MATEIIMPQLGESVVDGTVVEWLKQVGDAVEEYEPIVRVSTDKVDTEVPAPTSGVLLAIHIPEDNTVDSGVVLGVIGAPNEEVADAPSAPPSETHSALITQAPQTAKNPAPSSNNATGHVTPVVARMVQIHNLDLSQIEGTGRNGRITKKDVLAYMDQQPTTQADDDIPPWEQPGSGDLFKPTVEYDLDESSQATKPAKPKQSSKFQPKQTSQPALSKGDIPGELLAISGMRRSIAQHMVESKQTSPHVTTVFEADLSAIVNHRAQHKETYAKQGVRLTYTSYFVMAVVSALQDHPLLNARWTDEGIYQHHVANIGMAVALDEGLIVPVIKNAQDYNLMGLARHVNDLAERARNRQLKPDEVRDGTFSITNHGVSGSLFATPIINQPQSAILGVGALEKRVKVINDAIAIRPCAYLSLTFDHRLIDGATADHFVASVVAHLQTWANQ
jgi:pyruvate/2-oxoglutarate dehydrogenase complex dihydrolipoamide acyltransferase (E2) component